MASKVPYLNLNNGLKMPQLDFGTWKSLSGQGNQAVKDAIDIGYRHFDCAYVYGNEIEVGQGINAKIAEVIVKRRFIHNQQTLEHISPTRFGALEKTLENLNTPYLDLYLIHCPTAYQEGEENSPKDENGKIIFSDVDFVDTWRAMEKAVDAGLTKSIGISNFNAAQSQRILDACRIKPVTNQIECHPYLSQQKLSAFLKKHDIIVTAYSPLGSPARPWINEDDPVLLEDQRLMDLVAKYKKTKAQILIRYQIQRGHAVIPKSVTKDRIATNFDVFDFQLNEDDMKRIDSFDCNVRYCALDAAIGHPSHPFENDEF